MVNEYSLLNKNIWTWEGTGGWRNWPEDIHILFSSPNVIKW